jgi:hypothetical protein
MISGATPISHPASSRPADLPRVDSATLAAYAPRGLRWLRHVVGGEWDELRRLRPTMNDDEPFAQYAMRHHVGEYVLHQSGSPSAQGALPERWVEPLRAAVTTRSERTARLPAALAEAVDAFRSRKIDCLVLKGEPMALRYYGHAAMRRSVDIDLMVHVEDIDEALRCLWLMGYRCRARRVRRTPQGPCIRPSRLRTEHALALRRDPVTLDLHWRLRTAPAYRIDEAAIWAGAQRVAVNGRDYPTLNDEHALLLLLLSIAHDIGRGAARLKHLLDVRQVLAFSAERIDWPGFWRRRTEDNTLSVVVNALAVVMDVWDERQRMPAVEAAMAPYRSLVVAEAAESLALIERRGTWWSNVRWLMRVYPVAWARDLRWLIDRRLTHPGSIFVWMHHSMLAGIRGLAGRIQRRWTARRGILR